MKKNNNKGFTLAELLIVVAIIAVLAAIAIPIFNNNLEKSRQATDLANIRAAYAEAAAKALDTNEDGTATTPTMQSEKWDKIDDVEIGGGKIKTLLPESSKSKKAFTVTVSSENGEITKIE